MAQRPKEMVWDSWPSRADMFRFLGLLTLHFTRPLSSLGHSGDICFPLGPFLWGCLLLRAWYLGLASRLQVSFWAEEGPADNVAAQPWRQTPGHSCSWLSLGAVSQLTLPHCLSTVKVGKQLLLLQIWERWKSFVQIWNLGVWDLAQSSCQHWEPDLPTFGTYWPQFPAYSILQ